MNGITYVKLESQYPEDYTKRAALTPMEIDMNFNTLEGRDIKSISVFDGKLSINLYNGDTLSATVGKSDADKVADIIFDQPNGILTLVFADGTTKSIEGFATKSNTGVTVSVDNTLKGNGLPGNPVGLSPVSKTGWYRPVERIIHTCDKEKLPDHRHVAVGERYLTVEKISDYGCLYNYDSLRQIACDLRASNSPWRVPTKADWDDMLNAVEPCVDDKNHELNSGNRYLGHLAGKLLKSRDLWLHSQFSGVVEDASDNEPQDYVSYDFDCGCKEEKAHCKPPVCGEVGRPIHPEHKSHGGLDKYGFRVTPAGYFDDGGTYLYFKERANFWTATNYKMSSVYVKRFEFDHDNVHQDIVPSQMRLSIRLVKDYDGTNYNEREDILGQSYSTVLMPSEKDGSKIWTSVNIAFQDAKYKPFVPNDGHGLTTTKHFFINEWNGHDWIRYEMHDGECVIVKDAPHGNKNAEYRVIGGEIADVSSSLVKTVMHGVKFQLDAINHKIDEEIERSTDADKSHDEQIDNLDKRVSQLEENTSNIGQMAETLEQAVKDIQENKENIENLDKALKEEIENREKSLEEVNKKIEDLGTDVENLQKDVEDAAKDMEQLEEDLNKRIDDVDKKLSDEIEEVKKGNSDLSKDVEALADKIPVQEGSEYNPTTGELLIKSQGGTNDIKIKMIFDFGKF